MGCGPQQGEGVCHGSREAKEWAFWRAGLAKLNLEAADPVAIAEAVQSAVRDTFEEELRNETTADPAA